MHIHIHVRIHVASTLVRIRTHKCIYVHTRQHPQTYYTYAHISTREYAISHCQLRKYIHIQQLCRRINIYAYTYTCDTREYAIRQYAAT